jgi:hypothetical protein
VQLRRQSIDAINHQLQHASREGIYRMTTFTNQAASISPTALREGRIIQGDWRGRTATMAASWSAPSRRSDPTSIRQRLPCRPDADVARRAGASARRRHRADDVPWFMGELLTRAKVWSILDDTAWERIRTGYMIGLARQALASAAPASRTRNRNIGSRSSTPWSGSPRRSRRAIQRR